MELLIKADNPQDLAHKVTLLAEFLSAKSGTPPVPTFEEMTGSENKPVQAGKSSKAKKILVPEPATTTEEKSETAPTTTITREHLAGMLRTVIGKLGGNGARILMGKLGYASIGAVPESDFESFMNACEAAIKAHK